MSAPSWEATFGSLLRAHRLTVGLTQEALAERSGVSLRTIQELESGHAQPRRATALSLMVALIDTPGALPETPSLPQGTGSVPLYRPAAPPGRRPTDASGLRRAAVRLLAPLAKLMAAAAIAALAWLGYEYWSLTQATPGVHVSGEIEAEEVVVSSEITARVVNLSVSEGQHVAAGAELARLDDSQVQLQIALGDAAARRQLDLESEKLILRAPREGEVTRIVAHVGELTMPGQPVLVISDLTELKANLYVPVRDLGKVRVGEAVALTADPYPGRTFSAVITTVSPKAEYTPRNVQSQRDRLNMVFGVKARIENRDGALMPGLPVQATIPSDAPAD